MSDLDYNSSQLKEQRNLQELQGLIGKQLKEGAKTEDELLSLIPGAKYDEIVKVLKSMLFLKLITKDGYPVKYSLSKEILNGISEKKAIAENDKNQLKVSILIESKSNDKGELRKAMDQISENLKKDEQYVVYSLNVAEIVLHEDLFSTFISAELSCSSISSLFRLIYYYGATSVEVLKPDKYSVSLFDLQQASHIITEMTHGYAQMIYQLKQENAELSKLRK
jgi:hypothetical protein